MAELWFYHLEHTRLETVLPELLEKTLQRGWRALVHAHDSERLDALNTHLWTYRDDSFLPHGLASEPHPGDQPILLTGAQANANGADVLILTDPADPPLGAERLQGFARTILVFNGGDGAAVDAARSQWSAAKAAGIDVSYWQQSPQGRWTKKA